MTGVPENKKHRVLIADDEATIRHVLRQLLERAGHEVVAASDGLEAVAMFKETRPDLVLLDIMMPGLNGFEVCEKLKSDPEDRLIPVIMVTASSSAGNRIRALEAGADDFLSKPVDHVELKARVTSLLRIKRYTDDLERAEAVLFALAQSIEAKDPYTEGHCDRLSIYARELGKQFGLADEHLKALEIAGVVHDIGKIAVPDAILLKAGRLSPEEMTIVKEHPVTGERICKSLKSFRLILPIIRHHHEKCDGSGYPDGLRGDEIPLSARILQTVDVYDALRTERPYKPAFSLEKTLALMQEEVDKGWWDSKVFSELQKLVREEGFHVEVSAGVRSDMISV